MTISARAPGDADQKFARDAWLRALAKTANIADQGVILPVLIDRLAGEFDAAPALLAVEASMTYRQLGARSNQYARWGIALGIQAGDTVSLLMANCAEYLSIWLGLTRIGAVVALVNSQLSGDVLAHSINIGAPKALIVGADLAARWQASQPYAASQPGWMSFRKRISRLPTFELRRGNHPRDAVAALQSLLAMSSHA